MEIPKVNNVDESKAEEVKAAITLGFTADPLIRWIFPDPQKYLRSFAVWMDEFSKPSFDCLLYTSPSPRDPVSSRIPSSA